LAALLGLERLRSPARFGSWYAGIALNVGRHWLRRAGAVGWLLDELVDSQPGPEEQAEAAETAERVRQAVEILPPGQREAVLAFYWQGLTHAEAALQLGTSPGAIKARLHQARAALAPRLASYAPIETEVPSMACSTEPNWLEVEVSEVRRARGDDPTRRLHAIVLKERAGERLLPIYTGPSEAVALACTLEAVEMPRPMTYQMAANLLGAAGSRVVEVRITRLVESTFYALVVIDGPVGRVEVDTRPSDALNLALISSAPIRVDARLIDDPETIAHTAWEQFPTREYELVAEVRQRMEDQLASLAEERESGAR
jgi:RNA polymerase sigma factor (sigma-70 family)